MKARAAAAARALDETGFLNDNRSVRRGNLGRTIERSMKIVNSLMGDSENYNHQKFALIEYGERALASEHQRHARRCCGRNTADCFAPRMYF